MKDQIICKQTTCAAVWFIFFGLYFQLLLVLFVIEILPAVKRLRAAESTFDYGPTIPLGLTYIFQQTTPLVQLCRLGLFVIDLLFNESCHLKNNGRGKLWTSLLESIKLKPNKPLTNYGNAVRAGLTTLGVKWDKYRTALLAYSDMYRRTTRWRKQSEVQTTKPVSRAAADYVTWQVC